MTFAGAASFPGPARTPPGAPLTVEARIAQQRIRQAQQGYFKEISAWLQAKNDAPHDFPYGLSFAHDNSAPHRLRIASLKASFAAQNANTPNQTEAGQAVAALLAHMDEYHIRRHCAGQMIGKKLVAQIIQASHADVLEALRRALLLDELRNDPAVTHAFQFGVPAHLGLQDVERAADLSAMPSKDIQAVNAINYILSDSYLNKLRKMPDGAPVSIGGESFSKESVIDAVSAARNNSKLQELGPEAQLAAVAASLAASKIKKEEFRNPNAAVIAVTELPETTIQALKDGTADPKLVSEQISNNYCRATGDVAACKAATKEQFSPENLSKITNGLKNLSSTIAQTPNHNKSNAAIFSP